MIRLGFFLALAALLLAGCTTSARLVKTPVRQGMTRADLLATYGKPLRIERNPDGSEDWFYNFGSQQREVASTTDSTIHENEQTYSVSRTASTTTVMRPAPIHLVPSGHVSRPIPEGNVIVE